MDILTLLVIRRTSSCLNRVDSGERGAALVLQLFLCANKHDRNERPTVHFTTGRGSVTLRA
jgi:hypothetical protein